VEVFKCHFDEDIGGYGTDFNREGSMNKLE
jgi:hypothetical protein